MMVGKEIQRKLAANMTPIKGGVDNADLKDEDLYTGNTRKAWHGRALVVIRSTRNAGDIKLTVTSPGLSEATLNVKTISKKNNLAAAVHKKISSTKKSAYQVSLKS